MNIQENISLKPYNTFGIDVKARFFVEVQSLLQLQKVLELTAYPNRFFLGGGSNMLLTQDIDALVILLNLKGIAVVEEKEDHVWVEAKAGENWHDFVRWCLERDYGGLENLSLIPGNVGTAPIQNIGAYGVELKDVFAHCNAMEIATTEMFEFDKEFCQFGYRDSIFKTKAKGKYVITSVVFKLTAKNHSVNTGYGAIEKKLIEDGIVHPTIQDVSRAVIAIRESKLPNPKVIGNSGSFFKNPIVTLKLFNKLLNRFPEMPHYEQPKGVKIPAGWLIESCGFKGLRRGDAGVHDKQALVLVNFGDAKGSEIWELAQEIQAEVKKTFGIVLEPEVNVL